MRRVVTNDNYPLLIYQRFILNPEQDNLAFSCTMKMSIAIPLFFIQRDNIFGFAHTLFCVLFAFFLFLLTVLSCSQEL